MELSVKAFRHLAEEQGWRIEETANDRLRFLSPDKEGSVICSKSCSGRDLHNTRSLLRQAGLQFPRKEHPHMATSRGNLRAVEPAVEPDPVVPEEEIKDDTAPVDTQDLAEIVDLALQMVDELANTYKDFETSTIETLAGIRRDHRSIIERLTAVEALAKSAVQGDQLGQAVKELRAEAKRVEDAAKKAAAAADPIGAFRAKLRKP